MRRVLRLPFNFYFEKRICHTEARHRIETHGGMERLRVISIEKGSVIGFDKTTIGTLIVR